jgi:hypothetical protein
MNPRYFLPLATSLAAAVALTGPLGCGHAQEGLVLIGGQKVDATAIDRDPLALLPSGAVVAGYVDGTQLFGTSFGADLARITQSLLPIGPEANFSPARDVARVYGGIYAMQGADFCAVLQGNFDVERIQQAASQRAAAPSGQPLVKTRYGDFDMYTTANVGFVVLTQHTILSGNETGLRRAVDRLRYGKLERSIPAWMVALMSTEGAALAVAGDFTTPAAAAVLSQQAAWLGGVEILRVIGNFKAPGMNFAGTLTYRDADSASSGAGALSNVRQSIQGLGWLMALGFGAQPPDLRVAQQGKDVTFTMPLDARLMGGLFNMAAGKTQRTAFGF